MAETPVPPELHPDDLALCRRALAKGSKSFTVASWLLPARVRAPAAAFYAFCRAADDLVDEGDPQQGVEQLRRRIDDVYDGRRLDDPVDRALAVVVEQAAIPRVVLDALVEGFAWDAAQRRYETLIEVHEYGVRVASTVGVVMAMLMGRRDRAALARACDLGAAMQLTNIARDVGEDAGRGRVYLPVRELVRRGVDVDAWLADPQPTSAVRETTLELLVEADRLYARAASGIEVLPADCRPAIRAAAAIYRDIGRVVRLRGGDSITGRARIGGLRKLWLAGRAVVAVDSPDSLDHPPMPAARDLVEATAAG